MAIQKLELENFKGKTVSYEFGRVNIIKGKNGTGKSGVRDGLAFVFCGTDSIGTRNPTHLISKDQDGMKASVRTDKATITRTLSRKGNGTIKVERDGIASTYNQTQFEAMVGRVDTFLSAMIPGYLFELAEGKRQEVLADVLPKVDRIALLTELMGFEPTADEKLKYGFQRRPDLIASSVSTDRRPLQASIDQKKGRISQLSELQKPEAPAVDDVTSEIQAMEALKNTWKDHERLLKEFQDREYQINRINQDNDYKGKRRTEITDQLSTMVLKPKPDYKPIDLEVLRSKIKTLPASPVFLTEVEADHCHTCGQAVSIKSKEAVRARNTQAQAAHKTEVEAINKFNDDVRNEISVAHLANETSKKEYMDVINHNQRVEAMRKSLELELAGIVLLDAPEPLIKLPPPERVYEVQAHMTLIGRQDAYKKAVAIYDSKMEDFNGSVQMIETLNKEIAHFQTALTRLEIMEKALKDLPEVETKKQIGVFNTDKIIFDGNEVLVNGIPRRMLSTGERAKVHNYFCREVTLRMPKAHWIIFQDDADLLSNSNWDSITGGKAWDGANFQEFLVYVSESEMTVEIKE